MADLASLVKAGAIVPTSVQVPAGERVGGLSARRYLHPALPGRVLVRLVSDPIAPGVDAEMDILGFDAPTVTPALGLQRYRALGFPGWALVNDPKHARFALDVMKDFKKAAARAKSKPGHARDAFVEIGDRLARSVPHFLPSFWEEAGRAFVAEDSSSFAAQCFEKARSAEKEHALSVDEDLRSSVYLEFALAGAVAAKSFSGYAKELEKSYGAKVAYERFRELAVRRTLGGLPPWAGMAKDLRALAKGAKLDLAAEDARAVEELLDAPTIQRAPGDFWTTYREALIAFARRDVKARKRLRTLFPTPSSGAQGFADEWLSLLEAAGVLAALEDDTGEEPAGAAAGFLHALLTFVKGDTRALAYLERLAPRLRADATPVDTSFKHGWQLTLDLAVVERALVLGVPLADPSASFRLEGALVDPVRVAAEPRFARVLAAAVGNVIGQAAFESEAAGKSGFSAARTAWLEQQLVGLTKGALPGLSLTLGVLEQRTGPRIFAENPGAYAALESATAARALAVSLRGGVAAEFTWPVFEAAARELGAPQIVGAFPFAVLHDGKQRVIVVSGQERVLEHDVVMPPKASLQTVIYLDGQLFVSYWDPESGAQRAYWSRDPAATFTPEATPYHHGQDLVAMALVPGGGVTLGGRVIRAGDLGVAGGQGLCHDGVTYWTGQYVEGRTQLVELDPATGKTGRVSWPSFARAASERSDGKKLLVVSLLPTPKGAEDSPYGQRDGLLGHTMRAEGESYETTGIDGRTWTGSRALSGLLTFPGGDERPRGILATRHYNNGYRSGVELFDPDGVQLCSPGAEAWDHHPFVAVPPASCWNFLRARDAAGSAALRAVDESVASSLLAGEVTTLSSAITDPELRTAVNLQIAEAKKLGERLAKLVEARAPTAETIASDAGGVAGDQVIEALAPLLGRSWARGAVHAEIRAAGAALGFGDVREIPASGVAWPRLLGHLRGVSLYALSLALSPPLRAVVQHLLRLLAAESLLTDPQGRVRVFSAKVTADSPLLGPVGAAGFARVEAENAYYVQIVDQGLRLVVERAKEPGAFKLPGHADLVEERRLSTDDGGFLRAFLEHTEVPPPTAEAIARLSERTGLTRGEAALVFAGTPKLSTYEADFLGKEVREVLDLKVSDAKVARESLKATACETWLRVFSEAAAVDDPAVLFDPLARAERLAIGWNAVVGRRVALREELVLSCEKELDPPSRTTDLLAGLLEPASAAVLAFVDTPYRELFAWNSATDRFGAATLTSTCLLLPWLFATLPVGDPYRDAGPAFYDAVRQRLRDPAVMLPLGTLHAEEKLAPQNRALFEALGGTVGKLVVDQHQNTAESRDAGDIVATLQNKDTYLQAAFRPAKLEPGDARAERISAGAYTPSSALVAFRVLRSPGFAALVARLRTTPVDKGRYEADPSASAPEQVARVASDLGLSETAAMLYLQTLALAEPTQRNVLLWNDWKPPVYKQAVAELLRKKLVVEGKRERAGRECFLPGAWDKGHGKSLPMERWKQPLYALDKGQLPRTVALRPLHELFAAAVERVRRGDVPKLEEV